MHPSPKCRSVVRFWGPLPRKTLLDQNRHRKNKSPLSLFRPLADTLSVYSPKTLGKAEGNLSTKSTSRKRRGKGENETFFFPPIPALGQRQMQGKEGQRSRALCYAAREIVLYIVCIFICLYMNDKLCAAAAAPPTQAGMVQNFSRCCNFFFLLLLPGTELFIQGRGAKKHQQ